METSWAWPWWWTMVAINVINLGLCIHFYRQSLNSPDSQDPYVKWMRNMGMIFTLVALYRAIFVSRYLYQYAWFDTLANSSLLIRSFAWFAELSFAGLFAFALLRFNADTGLGSSVRNRLASLYIRRAPWVLLGCIFIAQFFATTGLITKSRLAFAIEETLWSAAFFSILPLAIIQAREAFTQSPAMTAELKSLRSSAAVILGWCLIYCTYGVIYHLPTEYWAVAFEQMETGVPALKTGASAVRDAFAIVNVTHNPSEWGFGFFLWHSAYFSVCVWLALFLMRAPRRLQGA